MLTPVRIAGFTSNLMKYSRLTETISYLSLAICRRRLETASHNTDAIKIFRKPPTERYPLEFVSCFLQRLQTNSYSTSKGFRVRFTKNCRNTSASTLKISKKISKPWRIWSRTDISAGSGVTLRRTPNHSKTDAWDAQAGSVLLQEKPQMTTEILEWWCRSLTSVECVHEPPQRRFLAIDWAV